jgi:hypothetical protein
LYTFKTNSYSKCALYIQSRGRILGRNWDKSLKGFPPWFHSQQRILLPSPTLSQSGLKLVCNVNSQDYTQKPQQNCTFMNSASLRYGEYLCLSSRASTLYIEDSVPGVKEIMLATAQSSFMILIPASDPYSSYHLGYRTRGTRVGSFASQCLIYQRRSIMKEYWSL